MAPFRESIFIRRWVLVAALAVVIPSGAPVVARALAGLALGGALYFPYPHSMRTIALDWRRSSCCSFGAFSSCAVAIEFGAV